MSGVYPVAIAAALPVAVDSPPSVGRLQSHSHRSADPTERRGRARQGQGVRAWGVHPEGRGSHTLRGGAVTGGT